MPLGSAVLDLEKAAQYPRPLTQHRSDAAEWRRVRGLRAESRTRKLQPWHLACLRKAGEAGVMELELDGWLGSPRAWGLLTEPKTAKK